MEDPFSTSQLESSHTYVKRRKKRSHLRESVGVGRMEEVRLECVLGITVNSSEGVAVCPLTGGHCGIEIQVQTLSFLNAYSIDNCAGRVGHAAGCAVVLRAEDGSQQFLISPDRKAISCIAWSQCGGFLATGEVGVSKQRVPNDRGVGSNQINHIGLLVLFNLIHTSSFTRLDISPWCECGTHASAPASASPPSPPIPSESTVWPSPPAAATSSLSGPSTTSRSTCGTGEPAARSPATRFPLM